MLRGGVCTGAEAGAGAQGWLMGLAMVARAGEVRQGGAATLLRLRVSQVSAPQQQRGQSGPRARGRSSEPGCCCQPPQPPSHSGSLKGQPGWIRRPLLDVLCPGSSQQLPTDPRSEGGCLGAGQRMGFPKAASPAHMGSSPDHGLAGGQYRPLPPSPGQGQPRGCGLALPSLLTPLAPSWGLG